ncbi:MULTISPECIES: LytR/AlgR family response regulator transcription factor [Flavobacterium]|uniref:LytTR family DNA-binding domain-containing protein n=1 Tax=Flavobacterium hankyongi TaxID=1176532 RepID=A0ABP9A1G8_9FLAO|nr:LytTR family DNA-binding domain-containing protein [Flavobacterium sp. N1846]
MKVLIIDDETKARQLLKAILEEYCPDITEIFLAENLMTGVELIKENDFQLVFLDIEMPEHSGLELFDYIDVKDVTFDLIFATAYSEFAIQAFEFSAIDYLLKPLRPNKVQEAVKKVSNKINQSQLQLRLLELKNTLATEKFNKIALPVEEGVLFIKTNEICYLEADGMYTNFFLNNDKKILISKPMKYFSDLLENKELFYKPHRSYLVNLKYLHKIVKKDGTYIEMEKGDRIPVSKEKKEELISLLQELQ